MTTSRTEEKSGLSPILLKFKDTLQNEFEKIVDEDHAKEISNALFKKIEFLLPTQDEDFINKRLSHFMNLVDDITYRLVLKNAIDSHEILNRLIKIQEHTYKIQTGDNSNFQKFKVEDKTTHLIEALALIYTSKVLSYTQMRELTNTTVDAYIESLKKIKFKSEQKNEIAPLKKLFNLIGQTEQFKDNEAFKEFSEIFEAKEVVEEEFLSNQLSEIIKKTLLEQPIIAEVACNIATAVNKDLRRLPHEDVVSAWSSPESNEFPGSNAERTEILSLCISAKSPSPSKLLLPVPQNNSSVINSSTMFGSGVNDSSEDEEQRNEYSFRK